ncbi:MAG: methylated-DNA--[protein]-cysteine S-methyltransferase [Oscillospiraceae bacterium]|jgi:methylated-DNA-protein-cysteine methyltransferase-like protein|nr:methylated-DNA--[protein]-cysteine S-methyltransferase [Oscillospiraceae bacterium]
MKKLTVFDRIYEVVKAIPQGKVATYGQVACMAGNPRWARVVGYALHANPNSAEIPCHRVVNRFGQCSTAFVFGGKNAQIDLLRSEDVDVSDEGFVDLSKYLTDFR